MKKILAVALTLFTIFMSYVVIGGFIQKQQKVTTSVPSKKTNTAVSKKPDILQIFTMKEVAGHNTSKNCWLIINNNVYSVGMFLSAHPGGASTITPYCGKEATKAFDTQDRGSRGGHSIQATQLLTEYLVGKIKPQ